MYDDIDIMYLHSTVTRNVSVIPKNDFRKSLVKIANLALF